jgi:crossover junction endodeoxyribonuclease RuvC
MLILGIDPGTVALGYGLIEAKDDQLRMLDCGVLRASHLKSIDRRLLQLYTSLIELLTRWKPDEVAIEAPFVARNVRSALAIGRAQAVAMLSAAVWNIPVYTYPPAKIKQMVANYGSSQKEQVGQMVRIQLGLKEVPQPSDAADALAVAICHFGTIKSTDILAWSKETTR